MNDLSRRHFLQYSGGLAVTALVPRAEVPLFASVSADTVRNRFWILGHVEGAYDNQWGLPVSSRMTPLQGAEYLGIPNIIMVRYGDKPAMPFDDYAKQYSGTKKLMWSIVGAGGGTSREEQDHVVELAKKMPNITTLFMDDFFHDGDITGGGAEKIWLAYNKPRFPVILSLHFRMPTIADEIELTQSNWRTGDYRGSDIAVDVRTDGIWNEVVRGRLENRGGAVTTLKLPGYPAEGVRIRFFGTYDTTEAKSVGLSGLRLLNDHQDVKIPGVRIESTSTIPGYEPAGLLKSMSLEEFEPPASCSIWDLREIREKLTLSEGRKLDLGVSLYMSQLNPAICRHLDLCDVIALWCSKTDELADLQDHFVKYRQLVPDKRTLLGVPMWDFGSRKPLPIDFMRKQCETGLQWLKEGQIEGMVFHASNICDMKIEAVEYAKQWIAEHGGEPV